MNAIPKTVISRTRHLCVATLMLLCWAAPVPAATFYTNSVADKVDIMPGDGICDADPGPATECTLRAAIMEANALPNVPTDNPPYDQIGVYSGTYTLSIAGRDEDGGATGDLDITDTVAIFGQTPNRPIIDGAGLDRVLDVRNNAILQDVIVQNGDATGVGIAGTGGGIRCFGSYTLGLIQDIVRSNSSAVEGGGVHGENCDVYISKSLIADNSATGTGGGIGTRFAKLIVGSSTVLDNQALPDSSGPGAAGGIAYTATDSSDYAYILQSSIDGNSGTFGAGLDLAGRAFLVDSTVAGNQGGYGGGAGVRTFGALAVTGSTIYCNHATGTSYAAGIYLQGSSPSVSMNHTILARNNNGDGEAECNGPLDSGGYNLIGDTTGCTVDGDTTGNQTGIDPMLTGPLKHPISAGTAGGLPAWLPRSMFGPSVDSGDPSGIFYDSDANPGTAEVELTRDQWNLDRPTDGDGDGTARNDIGAIESDVITIGGFENDPGACPAA